MKQLQPRQAQAALFYIFSSFGLMIGLWSAAIPYLQTRLQLSSSMLGWSIFCFGLGAILATVFGPTWITRFQTRPVMLLSGCGMWLLFPSTLFAPSILAFMALLTALGFCCGMLDTSMNSHGLTVEHHLKKPSLSMLHGGFSLGNVIGSALAALAVGLSSTIEFASIPIAILSISAFLLSFGYCYPHDFAPPNDSPEHETAKSYPAALIVIAGMTAISFFAEGAIGDWTGLYLRDNIAATPTQTAFSLGAFATGMTVGRFTGDWLRSRFDAMRLLILSSGLAALMMLAFLLVPNPQMALCALLLAGLGYANIVPLLFVRAAQVKGVAPAKGIAFAAGMGYASLLGGPALLGYLASQLGLMMALFLVVIGSCLLCMEAIWTHQHKKTAPI